MKEDLELIRAITGGEREQFEELMHRYQRLVFMTVAKHVPQSSVEDLAQQTFISAYKALRQFRGESSFAVWLTRIALRRCCDFWRGQERRREINESSLTKEQKEWVEKAGTGEAFAGAENEDRKHTAREVLHIVLGKLPPAERMAMCLVDFEDLPVKEAAEIMGCSITLLKVRAHRGRKKYRKLLEEISEEG